MLITFHAKCTYLIASKLTGELTTGEQNSWRTKLTVGNSRLSLSIATRINSVFTCHLSPPALEENDDTIVSYPGCDLLTVCLDKEQMGFLVYLFSSL